MARINRSDPIQRAVEDLGLSASADKIPADTLDKIQLTYDLNAKVTKFIASTAATTTGALSITLPTVSTGGQTFITHINCSYVKDATCDVASGTLSVAITPADSNVSTNAVRQSVLTTTAQSDTIAVSFPFPIKVKNASAITYGGTFAAGAMSRSLAVMGFITSSN